MAVMNRGGENPARSSDNFPGRSIANLNVPIYASRVRVAIILGIDLIGGKRPFIWTGSFGTFIDVIGIRFLRLNA